MGAPGVQYMHMGTFSTMHKYDVWFLFLLWIMAHAKRPADRTSTTDIWKHPTPSPDPLRLHRCSHARLHGRRRHVRRRGPAVVTTDDAGELRIFWHGGNAYRNTHFIQFRRTYPASRISSWRGESPFWLLRHVFRQRVADVTRRDFEFMNVNVKTDGYANIMT